MPKMSPVDETDNSVLTEYNVRFSKSLFTKDGSHGTVQFVNEENLTRGCVNISQWE